MARGGNVGGGRRENIDFAMLAGRALDAVDTLLAKWLPKGHKDGGPEYKSVNPTRSDTHEGSFSINTVTGKWGDFAAGDAGNDLISLCAYLFHDNDQIAAAYEVAAELGITLPPRKAGGSRASPPSDSAPPPAEKSSPSATAAADAEAPPAKKPATEWVPQRTAPADAPPAPEDHFKKGLPDCIWHYRDRDGATIGYVHRYAKSDGDKDIMPICWAIHEVTKRAAWRWMHFAEPRPLYGLWDLAAKPEATVLIVEGEKCRDVAALLFPELAVVTWPGGTNAEHKADWSPLKGRKVVIWPDCDAKREKLSKDEKDAGADPLSKPFLPESKQPGMKAALKIADRLHEEDCKLWLVTIPKPGEVADGWDVADFYEERDPAITVDYPDWLRSKLVPWEAVVSPPSEPTSPPNNAGAGREEEGCDDWRGNLLETQKGEIERCVANVYDILTHDAAWDGIIAFDEFAQKVVKLRPAPYVNGDVGEWGDQDTTHLAIWITRRYRFAPGKEIVSQAVDAVARNRTFNPLVNWLRGLPAWDGTKRIGSWLERYVGAIPSSDDQKEYLRLAGGWFLMGMIARALNSGCKFDYSLILEGEQGKRKSTILCALVGDAWFSDVELDLHNKDSMMALQGKWLLEIAEMGAMARSDEKRQKAFLSRRFDEFRIPFATSFVKLPRRLVFSGTTNEWEWNKDPTGGRRFWPVTVGVLDVEGLVEAREQLFAEALAYYEAGKRYWPEWDEQKRLFDPEQLKREQQESLVDALHDWVYLQYAEFSIATAAMDGLSLDASKLTRDLQTRIGTALRKLGCTKIEKRNGMTRFWYKPPERNEAGSTTGAPVSSVTTAKEGEIRAPF